MSWLVGIFVTDKDSGGGRVVSVLTSTSKVPVQIPLARKIFCAVLRKDENKRGWGCPFIKRPMSNFFLWSFMK